MERLFIVFDQKYQDYLYERSWADAAFAQSYLLGVVDSMRVVWDKDAVDAKQQFDEIMHRCHLVDDREETDYEKGNQITYRIHYSCG